MKMCLVIMMLLTEISPEWRSEDMSYPIRIVLDLDLLVHNNPDTIPKMKIIELNKNEMAYNGLEYLYRKDGKLYYKSRLDGLIVIIPDSSAFKQNMPNPHKDMIIRSIPLY